MTADVTRQVIGRMKDLRKRRGWSAQKLADAMTGVGAPWLDTTVAKLENGHRKNVTVAELAGLAEVFGVTPSDLLCPARCDRCHDAPPPGYTCNGCGHRTEEMT